MATNTEQRSIEITLNAQQANASIKDMAAGVGLMNNQLAKMAQDDPRREALKQDFLDLKARVKAARDEVNGFIKSEEQLRQESEALAQANAQTITDGQQLTASYRDMKAAAGLLEQQLELLSADDPGRAQMIADYQELRTRMAATREEFTQAAKSAAELRQEELALAAANQQVVASGQQAGASLREMKAAAGLLEKQLEELSADDPGRAQMIRDYQVLQQRIGTTRDEVKTYVKTEAELRQETEKLNRENREVILNGQKVSASFNDMKRAAQQLEDQLNELSGDDPGRQQLIADYQALQNRIEAIRSELGGAQQAAAGMQAGLGGITTASGLMRAGFQAAMAALLPLLAISKVWELVQAFFSLVAEVDHVRVAVATATGESGMMLETLTARVRALAETFGGEYTEQLKAADVLAKQMGISHAQAFDVMERGYLAGADRSGEFLDNVREYAVQFKAAGYSASEFVDYVSNAEMQGIFSDKGADVVKEFGIKIREQTTATRDALDAAFGQSFTNRIFAGINNGSLTVKQALAEVSAAMNDTRVPASKLQTVVADVFGGPGEDAGTAFLLTLHNVGKELETTAGKAGIYQQALADMLQANKDLAESEEELTKAFSGTGNGISLYWKEFKTGLYTVLAAAISGLDSLSATGSASIAALQSWGRSFVAVFSAIGDLNWAGARRAFSEMGEQSGNAYSQAYYDSLRKAQETHEAAAAVAEAGKPKPKVPNVATPADVTTGDGNTTRQADAAAEKSAAAKEAKRLAALEKLHKTEELAEQRHQEMLLNLQEAAIIAQGSQRGSELSKVMLDAQRKALVVKGTEAEKNAAIELLMQEAWQQQRELQAKYAKEDLDAAKKAADDKLRQQKEALDQQIELLEAEEARRQAELDMQEEQARADFDVAFANGLQSAADYEQARYEVRRAALQRELALIRDSLGIESATYKKVQTELLKNEKDHNKAVTADAEKAARAKRELARLELQTAGDVVSTTIDLLFKDEAARKKHHNLYTALAGAKIIMDGVQEVAAIWRYSAENPGNALTGGVAGAVIGGIQTALAAARTVVGLTRLKAFSFAEGGATGGGLNLAGLRNNDSGGMAISPLGQLMEQSGVRVGGNGQLVDDTGFAVAGIVHQDEYVIPKWLREDPQVMQVEGWLEQRRLRGYAQGGATSDGGRQASADELDLRDAGSATEQRLLEVLESLDQRLQSMEEWATSFEVVVDLLGLDRDLEKVKQVKNKSGIGLK